MTKRRAPKATAALRKALRERFCAPEWAYFEEVGNATGFACNRRADAVAMSLWPSRGLHLYGIECKASRADWIKEKTNPAKADAIAKYCDFWWLAIVDESIVKAGELPQSWGLLVLEGNKLVCKVEPKLLTPEPLSREFLAAVLRRASESLPALLKEAERAGYERGCAAGPEAHQLRMIELERERNQLKRAIAGFQEASGLAISEWNAGDIGNAVRKLMRAREVDPTTELEQAADTLRWSLKRIEEAAAQSRAAVKHASASEASAVLGGAS